MRVLLLSLALTALLPGCKRSGTEQPVTATTATTGTTATAPPTLPTTFPSIPAVVLSGNIPSVVPLPTDAPTNATPEQFRPYFDWFSWESFIALNWPVSGQGRGNPEQPGTPTVFTSMTNTTPVTWGTYKANWELFDQYDQRPTPWDDYHAPYAPALCPEAAEGEKQLLMMAKDDSAFTDVNEAFSFPLVDQQSNYVYFEVRYNKPQYDWIRGIDGEANKKTWLYLMQNLPAGTMVSLPPNSTNPADSIMLKAAWRNLSGMENSLRKRYYTVTAWVYNPQGSPQCTQQPMGLVGFHIAQKTKDFPQWIWSTFEQVDNVPPKIGNVPSSFNNGTDNPPTGTQGFANRPNFTSGNLPPTATPTQVSRLNPIPTTPRGASTVDVNNAFHAALPKDSVWQYYQLVITQWPTDPDSFKPPAKRGVYPEDAGQPFPVDGAVNVALETYFQNAQLAPGAFGNSCMSCHFNAGGGLRDFSWGLARRPHRDVPPDSKSNMKRAAQTALN